MTDRQSTCSMCTWVEWMILLLLSRMKTRDQTMNCLVINELDANMQKTNYIKKK